MYTQIKDFLSSSNNILITSHRNPDDDALGSTLALYNILLGMYPDKNIYANIEGGLMEDREFLKNINKVTTFENEKFLKEKDIDLLIMLDGNSFKRFGLKDDNNIEEIVKEENIKTITIDHHSPKDASEVDIFIQEDAGATSEIIYKIFVKEFNISIDKDIAECMILSIISDTGRFQWCKNPRQTFEISADLLEFDKNMIEYLTNKMNRYGKDELPVMEELIKNTSYGDDYTYSYISDSFTKKLRDENFDIGKFGAVTHSYMHEYLRGIDNNFWGFLVKPKLEEEGVYGVSFRAVNGTIDTTVFTGLHNGGGHIPASGCTIYADTIEQALETMLKTVEENKEKARI